MISYFRKHPSSLGGIVVIGAGLAWLAFGFFGVHTLLIDKQVSEALPTFDAEPAAQTSDADPSTDAEQPVPPDQPEVAVEQPATVPSESVAPEAADAETDTEPAPAEQPATPEIVAEYAGTFESDAHPTSGAAVVLGNGTGQRFLRFEDFATDNGPDLNVYLVNSSTGDVSDFVDLGDLTGNIGEQNYEIPVEVDLDRYDRVVIWCVRFGVGFGDALLDPV
jgi:hypothetical protein